MTPRMTQSTKGPPASTPLMDDGPIVTLCPRAILVPDKDPDSTSVSIDRFVCVKCKDGRCYCGSESDLSKLVGGQGTSLKTLRNGGLRPNLGGENGNGPKLEGEGGDTGPKFEGKGPNLEREVGGTGPNFGSKLEVGSKFKFRN